MRPDELGAALVIALDENLSLKQQQERDKRLLERRIEDARQKLEAALAEYRGAVEGLESRVNDLSESARRELAGSVAELRGSLAKARRELAEQGASASRSLNKAVDELAERISKAKREIAERVEEVAAQKPVEVTHTVVERVEHRVVEPDGSGVKDFARAENKNELVLELKDGTRFRVKLPQRIVQHIDQGGGGGGISETRVIELIAENASGGAWGDITGTLSDQTDLQGELDGKEDVGVAAAAVTAHEAAANPHPTYLTAAEGNAAYEVVGAVAAHEALGNPHPGYLTPAEGDVTYSAIGHNHAGVYEPADAAIQAHVISAHAPSNAQKNSDITKAEIEAKLIGEIASHTHAAAATPKLDDLAAPDDNTDLNASTSAHGLMQKYPGGTTNFLRADGTFASPTATAADPSYSPGSFTVATETAKMLCNHVKLVSAERITLEGTGRLSVYS